MRCLFLHKSFPAQFLHLAKFLGCDKNNQVVYLTSHTSGEMAGVQRVAYQVSRGPSKEVHNYLRNFEEAILYGQAAYREAAKLKAMGFKPDIIFGHSGWGPTLFMKDLFPNVPLVCYFEWFYRAYGSDVAFWPGEKLNVDTECRIKTKNAPILVDLYSCDAGASPTFWQHSQFPIDYARKIKVLYDGVDTNFFLPDKQAKYSLSELGIEVADADEVVTYVGRGMEPYRGFPQFMEALAMVLARRKKCHAVIVGTDRVVYGSQLPEGQTYKTIMLEKYPEIKERVHFTGHLSYLKYKKVLQASTVHVYLTRPFVLSWSFLDSLATGCALVGSDTPPVKEFLIDRVNGLLADFRSPKDIADKIEELLVDENLRKGLSLRARETALANLSLERAVKKQYDFLTNVINDFHH